MLNLFKTPSLKRGMISNELTNSKMMMKVTLIVMRIKRENIQNSINQSQKRKFINKVNNFTRIKS